MSLPFPRGLENWSEAEAQEMPRRVRAGLEWTCPEGNLPPFTNSTFTPSSTKARATIIMLKSRVFAIRKRFSTANIGKYAKIFALYKIFFVT